MPAKRKPHLACIALIDRRIKRALKRANARKRRPTPAQLVRDYKLMKAAEKAGVRAEMDAAVSAVYALAGLERRK